MQKEIKSVVLEKQESENRDELILETFVAKSYYQDSNAGKESIVSKTQNSLESKKFSIAILVEEIKPVSMESLKILIYQNW